MHLVTLVNAVGHVAVSCVAVCIAVLWQLVRWWSVSWQLVSWRSVCWQMLYFGGSVVNAVFSIAVLIRCTLAVSTLEDAVLWRSRW